MRLYNIVIYSFIKISLNLYKISTEYIWVLFNSINSYNSNVISTHPYIYPLGNWSPIALNPNNNNIILPDTLFYNITWRNLDLNPGTVSHIILDRSTLKTNSSADIKLSSLRFDGQSYNFGHSSFNTDNNLVDNPVIKITKITLDIYLQIISNLILKPCEYTYLVSNFILYY